MDAWDDPSRDRRSWRSPGENRELKKSVNRCVSATLSSSDCSTAYTRISMKEHSSGLGFDLYVTLNERLPGFHIERQRRRF